MPHLIMQNDRLTTINNATQMDLQGQAASESSGHCHINGSGGQLQFVRAGNASNGEVVHLHAKVTGCVYAMLIALRVTIGKPLASAGSTRSTRCDAVG